MGAKITSFAEYKVDHGRITQRYSRYEIQWRARHGLISDLMQWKPREVEGYPSQMSWGGTLVSFLEI